MRALVLIAGLALSGCMPALSVDGPDRISELDRACRERGGILIPSGAPSTGRPETDYLCRLTGGATRIPTS